MININKLCRLYKREVYLGVLMQNNLDIRLTAIELGTTISDVYRHVGQVKNVKRLIRRTTEQSNRLNKVLFNYLPNL